jgi:hypothetical protein
MNDWNEAINPSNDNKARGHGGSGAYQIVRSHHLEAMEWCNTTNIDHHQPKQ